MALADPVSDVRRVACRVLGELAEDGSRALPVLIKLATDGEASDRRAAGAAIVLVDPIGAEIGACGLDRQQRDRLLDTLSDLGEPARGLRRCIEKRLNTSDQTVDQTQLQSPAPSTTASRLDEHLAGALTKKQLSFVQCILASAVPVSFADLRNRLWRGQITDDTITKTVYRVNERLVEQKIPLLLHTANQRARRQYWTNNRTSRALLSLALSGRLRV